MSFNLSNYLAGGTTTVLPVTGRASQELDSGSSWKMMAFLAAHIPLGLVIPVSGTISVAHALLTLSVGLWWAMARDRLERVAYVGAYIAGAEVLWRISRSPVVYEFGKYATVLLFVVALMRNGRFRVPLLALLYFALLLPSTALTIMDLVPREARDMISFNLSGPLALLACAWFFSNLKISGDQLQRLFLALIGPVISIASLTVQSILGAPDIEFANRSSRAASGGFGPNQVSAILGLGALLIFLCLFNKRTSRWLKGLLLGTMLLLLIQSAMTFSRGGLYDFAGGVIVALFFLLKGSSSRLKVMLAVGLFLFVAAFVVFPRLNAFTGGALGSRFENTDPTGRDLIVEADLQTWLEHPLVGVGPGQASAYRASTFEAVAAHTEFSRLLAEHGIFGLAALICLLLMAGQQFFRAGTDKNRAVVGAMLVWSFMFMLGTAMRVVAPSFLFGLTFATFLTQQSSVGWLIIQTKPSTEPNTRRDPGDEKFNSPDLQVN
jgi:O-antigen ligase